MFLLSQEKWELPNGHNLTRALKGKPSAGDMIIKNQKSDIMQCM